MSRFKVRKYPLVISTGYYYCLEDDDGEIEDIVFDNAEEETAEQLCVFINKLIKQIDNYKRNQKEYVEIAKWLNSQLSIEVEEKVELMEWKERVTEILKHEYEGYEDKIWGTWVKSLSLRLGVDIDE